MDRCIKEFYFLFLLRSFFDPRISRDDIQDATEALHCGILEHLKSKSSLSTVISFKHRHFSFIFKNKGQKSNDSGHILLEKEDFSRCHFLNQWDMIVEELGDGVKIDFPVKVRLFLSWSPKNHTMAGESIVPLPRYRPEKLSLSFCKGACSLS